MNDHLRYLYSVTYRMERSDFVALNRVLTRRSPSRVAAELALYFGLLLAIVAVNAGSPERIPGLLADIFDFPTVLYFVPLIFFGPLLLLAIPWIMGLRAALLYNRNAVADKEVTLHLTAEGIEGGPTELYSRVGWAAVVKLIETPNHLFVQISPREALIIPRRAVPNEDVYNNLKGFVRARTGLSTYD
jgi:hypothetical protein